ncbi:hypothetical protein K458DRAFT_389114 [Lentithecium fluviatile CBS 122367]|uniref:LigB subunit of an aromatic-ring-opening dioxygenase LigAB n=1 Tax=Lentithecium fluviatile CBS 122367 TaxID=1168545 RepID=A0A6G1J359_9PLEO|nr:hypothetical protein K458DRAFT_389114 [Lentithecium fluviatile CBS 122367]
MMLGEDSNSATFWEKCGDEVLAHNIRGVIMMGAHWDARGTNRIDVAMKPNPNKSPIAYRVIGMLNEAGFDTRCNDTFDWIHDTFLDLIHTFPGGCPPTIIISMNARFDLHLHARVGSVVAKLREENYLVIGTGGAVHNLYRNHWVQMLRYTNNFAQPVPPDAAMLEFRQAAEDVLVRNCRKGRKKGALVNAVIRLMKHPYYWDAHGTDDHFMAACFVSGVVDGSDGGEDEECVLGAEDWELVNMSNSQFRIGKWVSAQA